MNKIDKDFEIIERLNNLEIGRKYRSRKEVVKALGYPEKKNRGNSSKHIQKILDRCTEYKKEGWSMTFTKIKKEPSNISKSLKTLEGYRVLQLIKDHHLKYIDDDNDENRTIITDVNKLLLGVGVCNGGFAKYRNVPSLFLSESNNVTLTNPNTAHDFMNLTNVKLKRNLYSALDFLQSQMILDYDRDVLFMDYTTNVRVYNDGFNNISKKILKNIDMSELEEEIKEVKTKRYSKVMMKSTIPGVCDENSDIKGVIPYYIDCKKELFLNKTLYYGIANEEEIIDVLDKDLTWKIYRAIDSDKNYSITKFFNELKDMLSDKLNEVYKKHDYHFESIEIHNIRSLIQIDYGLDYIEKIIDVDFGITRHEMNERIVSEIKQLAKNRHEKFVNKLENATREALEKLKDDFKYMRAKTSYIDDCNTLTDLLIKLGEHSRNKKTQTIERH